MKCRAPAFILFFASLPLLVGCGPTVVCTVETVVLPDYTCRRVMRMDAYANPRFPGQRIRLGDYFQFPPAEMYETYLAQPDKAAFAGAFPSFETIPADIVRFTPGSSRLGGNTFSFRAIDLIVAVLADFDETIHDIVVSREDGEAALDELVRLFVPEVMAVLNARYGQRYDMSRLESWLLNDLPAKLRRIYSGVWLIHNSRRSGVASLGEDFELYIFLKAEAEREGLTLADPGTPDIERENFRRLREYGIQLAERLCPPQQTGGAPLSREMFSSTIGDELLGALQKAVVARHGSVNEFLRKIGALIPRAFGSYLTPQIMPIYMLPDVTYFYRLRVPGQILQTNAVRDLNGDLVWTFSDRDISLSGQSIWARTIFIREPIVMSLGLRGFPENLAEIDRLFGFCIDAQSQPREALLTAFQQSAAARNLRPLEELAASASSPDAASARGVLDMFAKYRRGGNAQPGAQSLDARNVPDAAPSATEEGPATGDQSGSSALSAEQSSHPTPAPAHAAPPMFDIPDLPPAAQTRAQQSAVSSASAADAPTAPSQQFPPGSGGGAAPSAFGQSQGFAPPPLPPPIQ
ncbi:MAG: hypothetical protein LBJ46_06350 [Planctomycetota bacterium]|jgi:hypothetical protein|nr:hypothetical protein [Planctomycetota bacterium]